MRVDVLGAVAVSHDDRQVSGIALGGRRARVALVALALSEHPIPAERLAMIIWSDEPPPTWQPALRGVIRALRTALTPIGLGDQLLITTVPAGYSLDAAAETDIRSATHDLDLAEHEQDPARALQLATPAATLNGQDLLATEDGEWLRPHRETLDHLRSRAVEVIVRSAGAQNDHHRALAAARDLLESHPLDERAHRILIAALDHAGDRAGAVQAYERCRAMLAEQLGVDPSAETVAVYLKALRTDTLTTSARLPATSGAFVGRRAEQRQLAEKLATPGLVTLTGRGGVGKSRLALQAATIARGLWVSLTTTADDELVASQVALELGVTVADTDPATSSLNHLAPLGRTLLVLDGCEQVVDGVASLVSALVTGCAALTILVTGRLALGLDNEEQLHLEPLPGLQPGIDPRTNPQLQLLVKRVTEAGGDLVLDEQNTALVAALCQRSAGLPLALELVAAQLTVQSPADLLEELSDAPPEQDRLTALLQHSYALLSADEASVLRRCTVLGGSVSLPLIRGVVSDQDIPPIRIVRILRELTDRGLMSVDRSGPRWQYRQDDDIQRFAAGRLTEAELRAAFTRLANAVRTMLPDDAKAPPGPFADAITQITGSVRSLLAASADGRVDRDLGLELAFRLHRYWAATNVSEGRFWFSRLLDGAAPSPWTGLAYFAYGYLSYWTGDSEGALPILDTAVRQLRGHDDGYVARALMYLGGIADDLDRGVDAVDYVKESIGIAERIGDRNMYVGAAMGVGSVLAERCDPEAERYALDALESCRRNASPEQLAASLPTAVMICWQVGALSSARELLAEGLELLPEGRRIARVVLLSAATGIALADRDLEKAIGYGRTADEEAPALGVERELPLLRCLLARSLLAAGQLDEAADRAEAALHAATALTYSYPSALCLETAALIVSQRADYAESGEVGVLVATAADIRRRGNRPITPSLRDPSLSNMTGTAIAPTEAAAMASALLGVRTGTVQHAKGMS
ncbi:putative ATPase/DNA-binding SARP family transcriptional activator [Nakamurella sp. UYEF19]|uniref:ATP-binding protein n=1 Tax=Nakamurella sp. UYEF19 TaxID=1756392 RepID=UPI00339A7334